MSNVIKVENLGKKYVISHQKRERYTALRDVITDSVKRTGKRILHPFTSNAEYTGTREEFWALKDVSFNVEQGDRIGIIGRNGAGKSTLLKILSRITEPTTGWVHLKGRVASLLEVGTGFHPELTGRENIYLNGAILGMSKAEIEKKFDEIVDFAEIEKFLDTPVKRYSSGMYVRLAFAVAAHLEPEILVVDEVLAVGDAQFQKKCLGKMEDVGKEGRTVLFVSHNMGAILNLCNRGILLRSGMIEYQGEINKAVSLYQGYNLGTRLSIENCSRRGGSGGIEIKRVWVSDLNNKITHSINSTDSIFLNLEAVVDEQYQNKNNINTGFAIDSMDGRRLFTGVSSWVNKEIHTNGNCLVVRCKLSSIPLIPDKYLISASISYFGETLDYVEHCESIEISQREGLNYSNNIEYGFLDINYEFEVANV